MTQVAGSDPSPDPNTHYTVAEDNTDTPRSRASSLPPSEQDISEIVTYIRKATSAGQGSEEAEVAEEEGEETETQAEDELDTSYWDASAMAPLNARSAAAIANLRAYRPPHFPVWDRLPASRRAAVLLLLYADRRGDLRVIVTMRATSLRSFSGHAAFPGGKADSIHETPYQIARREAWEEIGLPLDSRLPPPFRIEQLCELPCNMAQTHLVVRPCVAFLHIDRGTPLPSSASTSNSPTTTTTTTTTTTLPQTQEGQEDGQDEDDMSIIPRLDAKEVAAVFTAPFHNFLLAKDEPRPERTRRPFPPGPWYDGRWMTVRGTSWRVHNYYVPVDGQKVRKPQPQPLPDENPPEAQPLNERHEMKAATTASDGSGGGGGAEVRVRNELARKLDEEEKETGRYKVWGMTAHILLDAARIAYKEEPEMEHNPHLGDEDIIAQAEAEGLLFDKKRGQEGGGTREGSADPAKM